MLSGFQTDKTCTYMYKHSFGDLLPVTCMFDLTWQSSKATVKDVGLTDNTINYMVYWLMDESLKEK